MLETFSNEPLVVRDHVGVDLLLNLKAIGRLAPFMRAEHTLGSAASAAKVPASSLAYWVQRFLKAGLIEVTKVVPRAGKPIPHYRAVSNEFQVPFDAMPPGTRDEFLVRGRTSAFEKFIAASNHATARAYADSGIRVAAGADRGVEINFIEPLAQDDFPGTEWWGSCMLTQDEADEVNQTLTALYEKFGQDHEGPGRTQYHLVLGFVPALEK